ncbi:MAG TPA: glycosyltransferase family 39 protein [Polyangia bacterium]|nr:glycosyltransferase family 39 protein [Polyangia bacterium]
MGLILTALAIAVRLVWVLAVPTRPVGDFAMYLESARYLVEHHGLDAAFIYMPGYVYLAAVIYALGGGLLAVKMIGVAAGGLATAAVHGTARAVFGRGAAIAAGLLCAFWPAGIAVSSVTGTDMPAAALLGLAVWLLARYAGKHPLGAPVLFGLAMGLASYVRAVALPLTALAALSFRARGARWVHVATRTALACLVAFLVLLPWGLRNRHVYGEFFLTDSHGGHTALVGANPNSEGTYSRSLNRLFAEGTGYALFSSPHRESDRVAYGLAKQWAAFSPGYAAGLLAAKADRLLGRERSLLYWPLYRQSVLPPGGWFDVHRAGIERLVDGSWAFFVGAIALGIVAAAARRNWAALALLPLPLALIGLYTLYFSEVRYQLAIVVLLLPFAGEGLAWLAGALRASIRPPGAGVRRRTAIEAAVAAAALALIFVGWPRLVAAGEGLRVRHRWGVCVCQVAGGKRLCDVRAIDPPPGRAPSPVRGVWDGFGLSLTGARAAAGFEVEVPAGRYAISLTVEAATPGVPATIELSAGGATLAQASWPADANPITLRGQALHGGGKLRIGLSAARGNSSGPDGGVTIWISAIEVEPDRA